MGAKGDKHTHRERMRERGEREKERGRAAGGGATAYVCDHGKFPRSTSHVAFPHAEEDVVRRHCCRRVLAPAGKSPGTEATGVSGHGQGAIVRHCEPPCGIVTCTWRHWFNTITTRARCAFSPTRAEAQGGVRVSSCSSEVASVRAVGIPAAHDKEHGVQGAQDKGLAGRRYSAVWGVEAHSGAAGGGEGSKTSIGEGVRAAGGTGWMRWHAT